jgi:hypothetical protein
MKDLVHQLLEVKMITLIALIVGSTLIIGEHLNAAFHAIEHANHRLRGLFQNVDFNNKEQFAAVVRTVKSDVLMNRSDQPPLNWSTLRYVFMQTGGPKCRENATSQKRSSPSYGKLTC